MSLVGGFSGVSAASARIAKIPFLSRLRLSRRLWCFCLWRFCSNPDISTFDHFEPLLAVIPVDMVSAKLRSIGKARRHCAQLRG